jgi:Domain of unknown function (DUF4157)
MAQQAPSKTQENKRFPQEAIGSQEQAHHSAASSPRSSVMTLQRAAGNRAVSQMLQAKLYVSQPAEKCEQEADQVAKQIMRTPTAAAQEQNKVSVRPHGSYPHPMEAPGLMPTVTPDIQARINALKGGTPLPESTRAHLESHIGYDFSRVRIHSDSRAADLTRAVSARAFTVGNDVVFGRGEYAPETMSGTGLLAHELTHVIQQGMAAPLQSLTSLTTSSEHIQGHAATHIFRAMDPRCRESQRFPGNLAWRGVPEHFVIQQDYHSNINPSSAIEFSIPGSAGFADIVDLPLHAIYEIKSYTQIANGLLEVQDYRDAAQRNCDPEAIWQLGTSYPGEASLKSSGISYTEWHFAPNGRLLLRRVIPLDLQTEVVAYQYIPEYPGVIIYHKRKKRRRREREKQKEAQLVKPKPKSAQQSRETHPSEEERNEPDQPPALNNTEMFVDNYDSVYYDLGYRYTIGPKGTRASEWMQVVYADGTVVDININDLADTPMSNIEWDVAMDQGYVGSGGRWFPKWMNPTTTPRLWAAKREVLGIMSEDVVAQIRISLQAVMFVITMGINLGMAGSIPRPNVRQIPRQIIPRAGKGMPGPRPPAPEGIPGPAPRPDISPPPWQIPPQIRPPIRPTL